MPILKSVNGVIKGKMVDKKNTPLGYGDVFVYTVSDSAYFDGVVGDINGNFKMENVETGEYYIKVSYLGYADNFISNISISKSNNTIDLGTITMKRGALQLAEMIVSGEKNVMEVRMDKKVFNVSKSIVSKGGNGLDILRDIPSVDVDADNNISLRGDQNVIVLVDGRRVSMSVSDFLEMFPSSAIDKVEIMTNPSAKYDPEGMSGIINIIMNKEKAKGFNVKPNLTAGYSDFGMINGSIGLNFRRNKINFTANVNAIKNKTWFSGESKRSYTVDTSVFYQNNNDYGESSGNSQYGKVGLDYFMNDKNTLYITGAGWMSEHEVDREINYFNVEDNDTVLYSNRRSSSPERIEGTGFQVNGGWQKKFKNDDHTLDVDADMFINLRNEDALFIERFFMKGNEFRPPLQQATDKDNYSMVMTNRVDYVNPLKLNTEYEAGFHSTTRQVITTIFSQTSNTSQELFIQDVHLNNTFKYDQQVFAIYNTFGHEIKKFSYKLGLRAEQTNTISNLVNTEEKNTNDYFSLFPTLHLNYKFSRKETMQLNYSRRIDRPYLEFLNPFPSYSDPKTVQQGNPDLKAEFIHVFEYSYNNYGGEITFNGSIFYRKITNLIRRFYETKGDIGIVTFKNFSNGDLSGAELIVGYSPAKKWKTRTTFVTWQSVINDDEFDENLNFGNYGWSVHLLSTHTIRQTWIAQITGRYNSSMEVLQGKLKPRYGVDFAINKTFKKKRGNINLRISDVFKTRVFEFESLDNLAGYSYNTTRRWESFGAFLTISYKFGNLGKAPDHEGDDENVPNDDFTTPDLQ